MATAASTPEVPWPALAGDPSGAGDESREFEAELAPLLGAAMRLATAMRLDRQEAEDAVQEAALRAWRRRGNRRAGTDLRPWFLAIVANQCRESRRSRWASVLPLADPRTAQAAAVHDADGALDVTTALRKLRYETRLAVVLRYYLDLPFDEVASVSNCTLEAARSRVRRGLAALAGTLAGPEIST